MIAKNDILNFEKRRQIYSYIEKNPGLHLKELSRKIKIPITTLKYHVRFLIKVGLIKEVSIEKYKRFFISEDVYLKDKEIFSFLRKEIPLKICLYLCFAYSFSQIELAKELNVKYSSLSYHLKKMLEMGIIEEAVVVDGIIYPNESCPSIIERRPVGSEKIYRRKNWTINDKIYSMLITNKFDSDEKIKAIVNSYIDIIEDAKDYKGPRRAKIFSVDFYIEKIIDEIFEIFPNPYCA